MGDTRTLTLVIDASTEVARRNLQAFADALGVSLEEAEARIARFDARLNIVGSGFAKASGLIVGGLAAIGTAAIAGGYALSGIVEKAVDFGGSIGDVAGKLGVTTDFLQQYRFAATQSGAASSEADSALGKFTTTVGKAAEGNKTAAGAFKSLGVDIADQNGNLKTVEQLYRDVTDAIAKLPDPARQSAEALKFFGEAGTNILGLLKQGSSGFDTLADAAGKLGLVLTPAVIQNLNDLGAKAAALKQVVDTKMAAAVGQNASALLALADAAGTAIDKIGTLVQRFVGLQALLARRGTVGAAVEGSTGLNEQLASPSGRLNYDNAQVKDLQTRIARAKSKGLGVGDLSAQLQKAQDFQDASLKEVLAANFPINGFASTSGGKVKQPPGPKPKPAPKVKTPKVAAAENPAFERLKEIPTEFDNSANDYLDGIEKQFNRKKLEDAFAVREIKVDPAAAEALKKVADESERAAAAASRFNSDLARGLADAIVYGGSLGDVLVNTFKRAAAEALESGIFDLLGGGSRNSGNKAGGFASLAKSIGSLIGGAFADGGDAPAGKISLVGERGPELIKPRGTMTVIPNDKLRGSNDNQRQLVDVRVRTEPSPFFLTMVENVTVSAGRRGGNEAVARSQRSRAASALGMGR